MKIAFSSPFTSRQSSMNLIKKEKKQPNTYVCSAISISNVNIPPVLTWNMYNTILTVD